MRCLVPVLIILGAVHPVLAQETINEPTSARADIPEGMVLIPAGTFEMGIDEEDLKQLVEMGRKVPHMSELHAKWWFGDEIPKHAIELDSFYMDKCEVTNKQFEQFVEETGYEAQGNWRKCAKKDRMDHPVVNVSWHDAKSYAQWAGKRLPTEAEWEYAAKGGKDVTWFPWGDSPDPQLANYRHQGETFFSGIPRLLGLIKVRTTPVGSYPPNGFGLYDMCGNVKEWCENERKPYPGGPKEDWIYTRYGPFREGAKPVYGRAVRGGSWLSPNAVFVRLTDRHRFEPDTSSWERGFRCAKSVE